MSSAEQGIDLEGWSCPLPLRHTDRIVLGHGGGGKLSSELIDKLCDEAERLVLDGRAA